MKLEPLMTYHADLKAPVEVGKGPLGNRMIFDVVGGSAEGPRISGKLLASGADWLVIDESGIARLDVRATLETHDGAHIYMHYHGILEMNEKVTAAMARGESTDYGETYFMTSPRFETGDPRYTWINRLVAVAEGR
ncbi:MAG: DUF3237 domain-containing protein, partial [Deltaproteobacteria bacterium]|nr:DUF3237 domain-containing protein [Deltaproteobacteria bacterium]